jgi:trk system potassium uptake protein TrkA
LKIVIIGAGEVGYDLANLLAREMHDVTVIDRNRANVNLCTETLDVLTLEGNATSVSDLVKAGVGKADNYDFQAKS